MKRLLFSALLCLCTSPLSAQNPSVDVHAYDFRIRLDDTGNTITAQALIRFEVTSPKLHQLDLDLTSSRSEHGIKVTAVGCDASAFTHGQNHLVLELDRTFKSGDMVTVSVDYQGQPQDGLLMGPNCHGNWTVFGDNWPSRARHWLPCVDHPSDKAFVNWEITAPSRYQVVAAGRLVETRDRLDGTRTTQYAGTAPIATKIMVFAAGEFAVERLDDGHGFTHESWLYPQDLDCGRQALKVAPNAALFFTRLLGPIPYHKLAHVQSRTRYGGTENAGAIFYYEKAFAAPEQAEGLIVHETAHQWFGDGVTECDWPHLWLSEGFATYLTHLWFESTQGAEILQQRLELDRKSIIAYHDSAPGSCVIDHHFTDPDQLLTPSRYERGGWVLHMLRQELGDEAFFRGLARYYTAYKNRNVSTDDFQNAMESVCGGSLDWFFNQWLTRPELPKLKLSWKNTDQGINIAIEQMQNGSAFRFTLPVKMVREDGQSVMKNFQIRDKIHSLALPIQVPIAEILLDPDVTLLFSQ